MTRAESAAHVSLEHAWVLPSMTSRHALTYHLVTGVVDGGLVMACVGRMAVSELAAITVDPPHRDRCVRCELDRRPETRVRCTISFDVARGGES